MASSYPGALDSFTNPTSTDAMDASAALYHDVQHANINDAVEAVQAELGTDPAGAQATVRARLDNLMIGQFSWRSGEWLSNIMTNTNTTTTVTLSADVLYLAPLWVPASKTLDRIAVRVGTGQASANCRIGLYASDGTSGLPTGSATDLGEIDVSTNGIKTLTISQAVTGGQVQWVGVLNETASVTLNAMNNGYARPWVGSEDGSSQNPVGYFSQSGATYTSGFPSIASLSAVTTGAPIVMVRCT